MATEYILIGALVAVALNLLTLAISISRYCEPGDQIDLGMVSARALIAATLGSWFGAMIAAVVLILR